MNADLLPDALATVFGRIVADARKEWLREVDRIGSETRALIADLRAENVELRSQLKELVDGEVGLQVWGAGRRHGGILPCSGAGGTQRLVAANSVTPCATPEHSPPSPPATRSTAP